VPEVFALHVAPEHSFAVCAVWGLRGRGWVGGCVCCGLGIGVWGFESGFGVCNFVGLVWGLGFGSGFCYQVHLRDLGLKIFHCARGGEGGRWAGPRAAGRWWREGLNVSFGNDSCMMPLEHIST
jgi:hypothetical protein